MRKSQFINEVELLYLGNIESGGEGFFNHSIGRAGWGGITDIVILPYTCPIYLFGHLAPRMYTAIHSSQQPLIPLTENIQICGLACIINSMCCCARI